MPYKAVGKCVYRKDTGKKVGCTTGSVKKYLAALHANVHDEGAKKITQKDVMAGIRKQMPPPVTTHKDKKTYDRKKFKSFKDYYEDITGVGGDMQNTDNATAENAGTLGYGSSDTSYDTEPGQEAPEDPLKYEGKKKSKKDVVGKAIQYLQKYKNDGLPTVGEPLKKFLNDLKAMAKDLQDVGIEPVDIIATIEQPNMAKQYLIRGPSVKGNPGKGALQDLMDLQAMDEISEDEPNPGGPDTTAMAGTEMSENFIDHKGPGKPGDSKRHGIKKHTSLSALDKIVHSKTASPRKKQLAHWQANMRRGKAKK
jgi:hypothetical protein